MATFQGLDILIGTPGKSLAFGQWLHQIHLSGSRQKRPSLTHKCRFPQPSQPTLSARVFFLERLPQVGKSSQLSLATQEGKALKAGWEVQLFQSQNLLHKEKSGLLKIRSFFPLLWKGN